MTDCGLAFAAEAVPLIEENALSASEPPLAKGTPVSIVQTDDEHLDPSERR